MEYKNKKRSFLNSIIVLFCIGVIVFTAYESIFPSIPELNQEAIEKTFQADPDYPYHYDQLPKEEQEKYKIMLYGLINYEKEIPLIDTTVKQMGDILTKIIFDHPELYYVNAKFQYQDMDHYLYFFPEYDLSKEEVKKTNKRIEAKTKAIIEKAKQETSPVKSARMIYDFVIDNNEYVENPNDQNIISSLVEGKTVCAGYTRAYQYIMNRAGQKCSYVRGTAKESIGQVKTGESHAWALVNIENDFYYCDTTWGDSVGEGTEHSCSGYFMMNSDEMLRCYNPEGEYELTKENKLNYFADELGYMTSYDKSIISKAVKIGKQNNTRIAEVKCANKDVFEKVKNKLKNAYLGYEVLSENGCFSQNTSYSWNDELLMIELYF